MNRDAAYLLDIVRFCREILNFVRGCDEAEFVADRRVQSAVMYNITIIGEAVKGLSPDFRDRNPQIPWRKIAGMRDKLVHDYRQINVVQVWRVVQVYIPELLVQI
jgi:uncharacterized protein with HEPN domain